MTRAPRIRPLFRDKRKREQFDQLLAAYAAKGAPLFHRDGTRGQNSFASHFWAGHAGLRGGLYQPDSPAYRRSPAYVFYAAGVVARTIDVNRPRQES